jgi:hypothetical protein
MWQLAPASPPVAVEDIDRRPKWEPTRPTLKKEWSRSIISMKRKVTTLTEANESALFRAPQFPSSLLHVEADLKGKKPFKDAILRTNMAWRLLDAVSWPSRRWRRNLCSFPTSKTPFLVSPPRTRNPYSRSLETSKKTSWTSQRPWEVGQRGVRNHRCFFQPGC